MKKAILTSALVFFVILAVSCDIKTNYPTESTGSVSVLNAPASGKTIKRIVVQTDWNGFGSNRSTRYDSPVSIPPGGKSQKIEISISASTYINGWNRFRVTVTLDDNSTKYIDIKVYEDIVNNLRYDGANLIED